MSGKVKKTRVNKTEGHIGREGRKGGRERFLGGQDLGRRREGNEKGRGREGRSKGKE